MLLIHKCRWSGTKLTGVSENNILLCLSDNFFFFLSPAKLNSRIRLFQMETLYFAITGHECVLRLIIFTVKLQVSVSLSFSNTSNIKIFFLMKFFAKQDEFNWWSVWLFGRCTSLLKVTWDVWCFSHMCPVNMNLKTADS